MGKVKETLELSTGEYTVVLELVMEVKHPGIRKMKVGQLRKMVDNLETMKPLKKYPDVLRVRVTLHHVRSEKDMTDVIIKDCHDTLVSKMHLNMLLVRGHLFEEGHGE